MNVTSDILEGLNPAQRQAVETIEGPVLILAGPGSGKTRVITHRIAYLLNTTGVNPHNILAVTFTNKAANEMRERLERLAPGRARYLTVGTFHAICSRWLRIEGAAIGLDTRFVIADEDDQTRLIKLVLKEIKLDEKKYAPRAFLSHISAAKSELRTQMEYAEHAKNYWEELVYRVYARYQELLQENRAQDFDDLLMNAVRLFRACQDVLEKYQDRYVYINVDEFQDTNTAQYALVRLLAAKNRNVCVVGDEDQSVYSWRQADYRNVFNFERDFPDTKVIYLEQNYRSTKTILEAARNVIALNQMRKDKNLWTENEAGERIVVHEAYNADDEAQYVVSEIQRLMARGIGQPRNCAVMYRANAQSRALEKAFVRERVPYRLIGTRFYERKEVKDILAYLRLIYNPLDGASLDRVINVPTRGLGAKTLDEVGRWAHGLGLPLYAALQKLWQYERGQGTERLPDLPAITNRSKQGVLNFVGIIEETTRMSEDLAVPELIKLVVSRSGYDEYVRDDTEQGEERWRNVEELVTVGAQYAELRPREGLASFLEEVALASDVDEYEEKSNAVTLITLHAAKGLEFPVVFIVGLEEGMCPHARSFDDVQKMEEERRLCYVGMTRAKTRLYLIYAMQRTIYGKSSPGEPSRFLGDIPPSLIQSRSAHSNGIPTPPPSHAALPATSAAVGRPVRSAGDFDGIDRVGVSGPPPRESGSRSPAFKKGDRVRHARFGDGIVLQSVLTAGDEEVTVLFNGVPKEKKLSLAFAPLTKV